MTITLTFTTIVGFKDQDLPLVQRKVKRKNIELSKYVEKIDLSEKDVVHIDLRSLSSCIGL